VSEPDHLIVGSGTNALVCAAILAGFLVAQRLS
jgi:phytoene dehydrogenase-like protein